MSRTGLMDMAVGDWTWGRAVVTHGTMPSAIDGRCPPVSLPVEGARRSVHFLREGGLSMTRYTTPRAAAFAAVFVLMTTTVLPLQPVFGEGGARRDVIRFEQQNRQDALKLAREAVDHGKQGHAGALVTSAEAALQQALKAGESPHVGEGIGELNQAIEHGKAGHADVATKHAELAVTHLSAM